MKLKWPIEQAPAAYRETNASLSMKTCDRIENLDTIPNTMDFRPRPNRSNRSSRALPALAGRKWMFIGLALLLPSLRALSGEDAAPTNDTPKRTLLLPKSPVAAAYVLGRLSNKELTEASRSEFVYVALLQRKGLEKKFRVEAMAGLATVRGTDPLTELLGGLGELDKKGEENTLLVRELSTLLLLRTPEELSAKRALLKRLATEAQLALTRQIGYAALVTAAGSVEKEWKSAEAVGSSQLADLVQSAQFLREARLLRELYPRLGPLVDQAEPVELRRAAIAAVAFVPGVEAEVFGKLAALVRSGVEPGPVVASLLRVPKRTWPKDLAGPLTASLIQFLQSVPVSERTQDEFISAIQFAGDLASLLPPEESRAASNRLRELGVKVVFIRTLIEQSLYDTKRIVIEAGKPVEIVFQNDDAMPHNLVIGVPGSLEDIGLAAEKMPPEPDARGLTYVPDSPKVLHATRLLQFGEKEKLSFTAPSEPGDYLYVCTFPGHWRRMFGALVVVNDVDAYLASHPEAEPPPTTEWQVEDLAGDLEKLGPGRNLEAGRQLFTALACAQCHKLGPLGYGFGPELTDVLLRWKGDRLGVLREILEPSKVIADRYRNVAFELKDGESVSGLIIKEDAAGVTIHSGPADTLIQALKPANIATRQPQASSLMPVGLLSQLTKDQILDLFAFVESGGKTGADGHQH